MIPILTALIILMISGGFVSAYFDSKKDTTCWYADNKKWHCSYCTHKESLNPHQEITK